MVFSMVWKTLLLLPAAVIPGIMTRNNGALVEASVIIGATRPAKNQALTGQLSCLAAVDAPKRSARLGEVQRTGKFS